MDHRITKSEIIEDLQRLEAELGRPPSSGDIRKHGCYNTRTVRQRFGGVPEARKAAGVDGALRRSQSTPDEELIRHLKEIAEEFGTTPTKEEFNEYGDYSTQTYREHFGSWNDALRKAGLELNQPYNAGATIECDWCGDVFETRPSRIGLKRFCSNECKHKKASEEMRGENSPTWNPGHDTDHRYAGGWKQKRRTAIELHDNQCAGCGLSVSEHQQIYDQSLHVHHLKDDDEAAVQYLVPLCIPCHATWEKYAPLAAPVVTREAFT